MEFLEKNAADQIKDIMIYYYLSYRDLTNVLGISDAALKRWIRHKATPTGLHKKVLESLYLITLDKTIDRTKASMKVKLGIGFLIHASVTDHG